MSEMCNTLNDLKQSLLSFKYDTDKTVKKRKYLNYYGFETKHLTHQFDVVECKGKLISVQSFRPDNPKAVALVLHGYLDHTGSLRSMINYLTERQYHVISYDMPGHGLSSGERASIEDFSEYSNTLKIICEKYLASTTQPAYVVAHSTSGGIVLQNASELSETIEKIVLVAPLVRCHCWRIAKMGISLLKPFIHEVKRLYTPNSYNQQYLQFTRHDPLQYNKLPIKWVDSMIQWKKETMMQLPTCDKEVFVIQGDKDKTVDWKYNLQFINRKFPNSYIEIVKGGKHQLLNEKEDIQKNILRKIDAYFEGRRKPSPVLGYTSSSKPFTIQ
ncbi:alpha/beta hydrolase [Bacillus sp. FJAT-45350]|uniref:alpha/beta hydrolase n=1 Tax=Bacillus sp. FJAT-45350 TaxID=2011014 RepID=UPI000BB7ACBF|nr:alpha/beta hydrolase [Bacillus sp. FJAT-45350]